VRKPLRALCGQGIVAHIVFGCCPVCVAYFLLIFLLLIKLSSFRFLPFLFSPSSPLALSPSSLLCLSSLSPLERERRFSGRWDNGSFYWWFRD